METFKVKGEPFIKITASTWYKDSHSLYDYESTKVERKDIIIPLSTKILSFYRKK